MLVSKLKKIEKTETSKYMAAKRKAEREAKGKIEAHIKWLKENEYTKSNLEANIARQLKEGWVDKDGKFTIVKLRLDKWDSEKPTDHEPEWHQAIIEHIQKLFEKDGFESIVSRWDCTYYESWIDMEFKWKR